MCSSICSASCRPFSHRRDERVDSVVDRVPAALDEAVRVEQQDASGGQLDDALSVLRAESGSEREPSSALEELDPTVGERDNGRRMPCRGVAENARRRVEDGIDDRSERRIEPVAGEAVEPRERRRRLQPLDGDRAEGVPQLAHVRGRVHSLPHDVTHDQAEPAVAQLDGVEPVSADVQALRAREVARGDLHSRDTWQRDGQDASLEGLGDRALRVEVPRTVESLRSLAGQSPEEAVVVVVERDRLCPAELEDADGLTTRDERHGEPRARGAEPAGVRRLEPRDPTSHDARERGTVVERDLGRMLLVRSATARTRPADAGPGARRRARRRIAEEAWVPSSAAAMTTSATSLEVSAFERAAVVR